MAGGEDPLRVDDRAAAEADRIVHIAVEADLPRIFAVRRGRSPNDHLGISLAEGLTIDADHEAGKQQQSRNKDFDSPHVISSGTEIFDVVVGELG